ncbi:MAG: DUF3299 domain-containing protein [Spirosomaceae bacterium]|nr:DUF3299 domain-containing protein [Spirosomataceae bacterium]
MKIVYKLLIMSLLCWCFEANAQSTLITWKTLKDVRFQNKFFKDLGEYLLFPTFGESVKKLEGKSVSIRGYMIPVDVNEGLYVISALPMSSCFFCGGSGPETIIEVNFKNKKMRFKTDEVRTIKGILKLNDSEIEHMNYILNTAELVE